tara:strand:+ start:161 stop:448 length:288 start_codon:yes stop_codon:yes gene_type:complete
MGVRPNEKRVFKNYKFVITRTDMPCFKAYFTNYYDIKADIGIPKTTFYSIVGGKEFNKWKNYSIEKCKIPVKDIVRPPVHIINVEKKPMNKMVEF